MYLGSDATLLGEPVVFELHATASQILPRTSFAVVDITGNETSLYVLAEHPDKKYTAQNFPGENEILYKAGNFVGFEFLGYDPTLYAEKFEQKTNRGGDDLAPLIDFLRFVSESTDAEFAAQLENWIDISSLTRMMTLDNLLNNNDSFDGMGSNFYLFYSKDAAKFTIFFWDQSSILTKK